jgi:hypothetical protein
MITMRNNAFVERAIQSEHERAEACYERVTSAEAHYAEKAPYYLTPEEEQAFRDSIIASIRAVDKAEEERKRLALKKERGDRFLAICAGLGIETVEGDE